MQWRHSKWISDVYTESEASFVISHVIFTETIQASNRGFIWNAFFCSTHAPTLCFKRHITTCLPDYPPAAGPCCRPPACLTTRLLPDPVADPCLPDYPPVADPSPVRLPACCRPTACPTTRLLPTHRLSDYPPVADPSPVRLPACCRSIACPTTHLLPIHRLSDYPPVGDPSPVQLPACCYSPALINSLSFHPVSASLCSAFGFTRPAL